MKLNINHIILSRFLKIEIDFYHMLGNCNHCLYTFKSVNICFRLVHSILHFINYFKCIIYRYSPIYNLHRSRPPVRARSWQTFCTTMRTIYYNSVYYYGMVAGRYYYNIEFIVVRWAFERHTRNIIAADWVYRTRRAMWIVCLLMAATKHFNIAAAYGVVHRDIIIDYQWYSAYTAGV